MDINKRIKLSEPMTKVKSHSTSPGFKGKSRKTQRTQTASKKLLPARFSKRKVKYSTRLKVIENLTITTGNVKAPTKLDP